MPASPTWRWSRTPARRSLSPAAAGTYGRDLQIRGGNWRYQDSRLRASGSVGLKKGIRFMIRILFTGLLLAGFASSALAANPEVGEKVFRSQCSICHSTAPGRNMLGPSLFGVVGRKAGTEKGFHYSVDHKKLDLTWDAANLDKYLENPRAMVKDTTMTYAGLKDAAKRADVIAYLETLH